VSSTTSLIDPCSPPSGCAAGTSSNAVALRTSRPGPAGPASTSETGSGTTTSRCAPPAPRRTLPRSIRRAWPTGPRKDCPRPRSPPAPATAPAASASCSAAPAFPPEPRSRRSPALTPVEIADVVRLYRDEGRSLAAVGAAFGHGPDWARARVHAAGLTIRPGGTPRTGLDSRAAPRLAARRRPDRRRDRYPGRPVGGHRCRGAPQSRGDRAAAAI